MTGKQNYLWQEISQFKGWEEFERFETWIKQQIFDGAVLEKPVSKPYSQAGLKEKWFEHISSRETWRLIYPEPPFTGFFGRV